MYIINSKDCISETHQRYGIWNARHIWLFVQQLVQASNKENIKNIVRQIPQWSVVSPKHGQ